MASTQNDKITMHSVMILMSWFSISQKKKKGKTFSKRENLFKVTNNNTISNHFRPMFPSRDFLVSGATERKQKKKVPTQIVIKTTLHHP